MSDVDVFFDQISRTRKNRQNNVCNTLTLIQVVKCNIIDLCFKTIFGEKFGENIRVLSSNYSYFLQKGDHNIVLF
jgi:hypothetical protein